MFIFETTLDHTKNVDKEVYKQKHYYTTIVIGL